jgi:hypothetical protein
VNAKHTPGPWTTEENVRAGGIIHFAVTNRENGNEWMVCSITPMHLMRDVDKSNARLIAAAPELLEEIQRLLAAYAPLGFYSKSCNCDKCEATKKAMALVAKAKGGAQ